MSDRLCSAAALTRCEDLSPRAEVAEGRAPRYNGGMETTAGAGYAVIVTEAPVTVKAKKTDDSTETIKVLESVGQHTFIAMSGETVFDGGAVGLVQGPFDPARALGGDNGGAGGKPIYTLGSDNTYKFVVSETTAELTRPASATDWFHVRMPMHLHGNNLQHGAGASIFAQGSIVSSMSARGFYVEDSGVRIVELDSDATGHAYMELNGSRVLTEGGERVLNATMSGTTAIVTMQHATVVEVPSAATSVVVTPNVVDGFSKQTHLILTPADTMPSGWLSATDGAVVRWPFGEIAMPAGWSYIITLVQVGKVILANALPVDLSTPAA